MKCQKGLSRVISVLLTLTLMLGLLPTQALALSSNGQAPDPMMFKTMRMDGIRTTNPISKYQCSTKENQFYRSVDLNQPGTWVQLTYVIQVSQPISLELYKYNGDPPTDGSIIMDYSPNPDDIEEFLDQNGPIGYLHGIRVTDNVIPVMPGGDIYTDPKVDWNEIDHDEWVSVLNESIVQGTRPAETMKDIYAFGFQGDQALGLNSEDEKFETNRTIRIFTKGHNKSGPR